VGGVLVVALGVGLASPVRSLSPVRVRLASVWVGHPAGLELRVIVTVGLVSMLSGRLAISVGVVDWAGSELAASVSGRPPGSVAMAVMVVVAAVVLEA
jgi:hypothetical protein